jgi:hypothetical protein
MKRGGRGDEEGRQLEAVEEQGENEEDRWVFGGEPERLLV